MQPIKQYEIITAFSQPKLEQLVNAAIQKGWQPFGGVSIATGKVNTSGYLDNAGKETIIMAQVVVAY